MTKKRVLICGDSFCTTDPDYPGVHWSEILLNHSPDVEVVNLAMGGASNFLILLQLQQGLRLDPDFVILSFTDYSRIEFDKDSNALPIDLGAAEMSEYFKNRFLTSCHHLNDEQSHAVKICRTTLSDDVEKLKNYSYISLALLTAKQQVKQFCFSFGGFENYQTLLCKNYIQDNLIEFRNNQLYTNLWHHKDPKQLSRPYFHVTNKNVHVLFANECIEKMYE
jgi:hypothetical protein